MMYMGSGYITQRKIEKEDYSPFKGIVDDSLTEVTAEMLDGVTTISYYAFYQCANLISVVIPSGVTSIENSAFWGCRLLTNINLPSNLTQLGELVFNGCSSLTSIVIPNGITYLENRVFAGCNALTSVTIPSSVTSFSEIVFQGCTSLVNVTVEATTPPTLRYDPFYYSPSSLVIYVPAESVEAYKTASYWSTYASKIQAIPST